MEHKFVTHRNRAYGAILLVGVFVCLASLLGKAQTLKSIAVTPSTSVLTRGGTRQFSAQGTFTDGTTADLTAAVAWNSSNPSAVFISNSPGIFEETWMTEPAGTYWGPFGPWNVTGSVDVLGPTYYGFLCTLAGESPCVDLDGSSPGSLSTATPLSFSPGKTYVLQFDLAGSQRGIPINLSIGLGTIYSEVFRLEPNDKFKTFTRTFSVAAPTTATLRLRDNGYNIGALVGPIRIYDESLIHGMAAALSYGVSTLTASAGPVSGSATVTVLSPALALSTTALDFPTQIVGAPSNAQTITLTNPGTAPLSIASILASGDYVQINDCGDTLAPLGSCTITVNFVPSGGGPRTGTLTIASDAPGSPHGVALTGSALGINALVVTPKSPLTTPGGVVPFAATGTLSDGSTRDLTSMVGWSSSDPTVANISNGKGVFQENWTETPAGTYFAGFGRWSVTGSVDVLGPTYYGYLCTAAGNSYACVDLDGSSPGIITTASALDLQAGTTYTLQFELAGSQRGIADQVQVTLGSAYAETFTLAPADTFKTITRTFSFSNPVSAKLAFKNIGGWNVGALLGRVLLYDSTGIQGLATGIAPGATVISAVLGPASASGVLTVALPAAPAATLSASSLGFGDQVIGTASARTITLTNTGNAYLNISGLSISGEYTQSGNCPAALAPAAGCSINVTFTPASLGPKAGLLSISDNASGSPQTVALSGNGIAQPVALTGLAVNPNSALGGDVVQATIALSGGAPANGAVVSVASSNPALAVVPANVTIAGGSASASFPVATAAVAVATSLNISVSYNGGTKSATLSLAAPRPFMSASSSALKFGVYEVVLSGNGSVPNPFTTTATVTFTPPSGAAVTVKAFHDGGNTWRARVYVTEAGAWQWISSSASDLLLNGHAGSFAAVDAGLRGTLRKHTQNPRQFMTDDGRWFLYLADTGYAFFDATETQWQGYVQDDVAHGITAFRTDIDPNEQDSYWTDQAGTRYNLANFRTVDERLQWLLNTYPGTFVQLRLLTPPEFGKDDVFWSSLPQSTVLDLVDYMAARVTAYPNLIYEIFDDTWCDSTFTNTRAIARLVGTAWKAADPWKHLMSSGPNRGATVCFLGPQDTWVDYIALETAWSLNAAEVPLYANYPMHVLMEEDYYEGDDRGFAPANPTYFYRWQFWSWTLAGGSATYGGLWQNLLPYSVQGLSGLDSLKYLPAYFRDRNIDLAAFVSDDAVAADATPGQNCGVLKATRRGTDEFLVYAPNASQCGQYATLNTKRAAVLQVDLRGDSRTYRVEWFRPGDGTALNGGTVGGGARVTLTSPWQGYDVVLRLVAQP